MNSDTHDSSLLRKLVQDDLALVLAWRNHPDIRRYMFSTHEITFDEHCSWFARASQDPSRHLLLFEQNGQPLGFVNLHVLNPIAGVADWGFYVSPDAPKGTGKSLGTTVLKYAFEQLNLHKLCGQALDFNEKSIHFHLRMGFRQEGVLREQHFDGIHYHSIVCFGLLRQERINNP